MKAIVATMLAALSMLLLAPARGVHVRVSPIQKVLEMLSSMQAKVVAQGENAQTVYNEYSHWCQDRSRELGYAIKEGKAEVGELTAVLDKMAADIEAYGGKIEQLTGQISSEETEMKEAAAERETEDHEFKLVEKDLLETSAAVERALSILEREAAKSGTAFVQTSQMSDLTKVLSTMVEASSLTSADASKLTVLIQDSESDGSEEDAEEFDEALNVATSSTKSSRSSTIIEQLESLNEKSQSQLEDARKKESESIFSFKMKRQSLEESIRFANKDLGEAKQALAACQEKSATSQGDLTTTQKNLAADKKSLSELHHDCMSKATAFEEETKSRGEELNALQEAKKVIQDTTGAADEQTYGNDESKEGASFLQVKAATKMRHTDVLKMVRKLGRDYKSMALVHLASRISSVLKMGSANGMDPFAKVKGLLSDMLDKLEKEASDEAEHKEYCDKEMGETTEKKEDKSDDLKKITTKLDQMTSHSAKLKEEVAVLQSEMSELVRTQAQMDSMRREEKAIFLENKPELETGLSGVKTALQTLREYYSMDEEKEKSHDASTSAGVNVIGLLEVIESDFSKGLAELMAEESSAASEYEKETEENNIDKAVKNKDIAFKSKEATALDKAAADLGADRDGASSELDAIYEYLENLKKMCIAKPDSYEEKKKKREAEMEGLKEALKTLESESFMQRPSSRRTLRGRSQPDA